MSSVPTLFVPGRVRTAPGDDIDLSRVRPIDYINSFIDRARAATGIKNRLLILKAETASGKSTGLPAELYKKFIMTTGSTRGIICTQPRTLTTVQNIIEIASIPTYSFFKIGQNIGWSTRYNKFKPTKPGLLMATIGTLSMLLISLTDQQICDKYQFIIIDETHERDLETDFAIMRLRALLTRIADRPDCPFVILMSATFDPMVFLGYFHEVDHSVSETNNFIWVEGRSFGVKQHWKWAGENMTFSQLTRAAGDAVKHIVTGTRGLKDQSAEADILIFMPGMKEIKETVIELEKINLDLIKNHRQSMSILAIDSRSQTAQTKDYRLLFAPIEQHPAVGGIKPLRRVIVTTNIAETGLTLPNLKYVIDSGIAREKQYYPNSYVTGLVNTPAPKSRIMQRIGRAGRKFEGEFFPLYSESTFNSLQVQQLPRIYLEDCSDLLLKIAVLDDTNDFIPDFSKISLLDNPAPECITTAVESLYALGYIIPVKNDSNIITGWKCSPTARPCIESSLPHRLFKMIVSSFTWGVSPLDMVTIAAFITIEKKEFNLKSRETPSWINIIKQAVFLTHSDTYSAFSYYLLVADEFIFGLFLYKCIMDKLMSSDGIISAREFCVNNGINWSGIEKFLQLREEYIESLIAAKVNVFHDGMNFYDILDNKTEYISSIKRCIYEAYRMQIITYSEEFACYVSPCGRKMDVPELLAREGWLYKSMHELGIEKFTMPKYLVTDLLELTKDKKTCIYRITSSRISALDGFCAHDEYFI